MNFSLIGILIRLRYKLLWAKTRSRSGKIALFFAGYLLLVMVMAFLSMGGIGAGMQAIRSGKGPLVAGDRAGRHLPARAARQRGAGVRDGRHLFGYRAPPLSPQRARAPPGAPFHRHRGPILVPVPRLGPGRGFGAVPLRRGIVLAGIDRRPAVVGLQLPGRPRGGHPGGPPDGEEGRRRGADSSGDRLRDVAANGDARIQEPGDCRTAQTVVDLVAAGRRRSRHDAGGLDGCLGFGGGCRLADRHGRAAGGFGAPAAQSPSRAGHQSGMGRPHRPVRRTVRHAERPAGGAVAALLLPQQPVSRRFCAGIADLRPA